MYSVGIAPNIRIDVCGGNIVVEILWWKYFGGNMRIDVSGGNIVVEILELMFVVEILDILDKVNCAKL